MFEPSWKKRNDDLSVQFQCIGVQRHEHPQCNSECLYRHPPLVYYTVEDIAEVGGDKAGAHTSHLMTSHTSIYETYRRLLEYGTLFPYKTSGMVLHVRDN